MPCLGKYRHMMMTNEHNDYFCPDILRDEISKNNKNMLLIDCRPQAEYTRCQVRGAINISLPSLMLKRLKKGNLSMSSLIQNNEAKERFNKQAKTATIVLYDESSTDLNSDPLSVITLLVNKLRQDGYQVFYLLGGFSTFRERFPEYCQSPDHESNILGLCNLRLLDEPKLKECELLSSPINCPFPVQVLPYLYLGCAKNSADLAQLKKDGITDILNVTSNVPNLFETDTNFRYLQIPISDHWSQSLSSFFPQAIQFIDEARSSQRGVLVHCLAGISRSVTVTVAYLMSRENMTLNQAYDHVKRCKPNISPNFTFMGQLLDFEKNLVSSERSLESDWADDLLNGGSETLSTMIGNCCLSSNSSPSSYSSLSCNISPNSNSSPGCSTSTCNNRPGSNSNPISNNSNPISNSSPV